jgi:predicted RNA-binding protein with PUA-like domain
VVGVRPRAWPAVNIRSDQELQIDIRLESKKPDARGNAGTANRTNNRLGLLSVRTHEWRKLVPGQAHQQ